MRRIAVALLAVAWAASLPTFLAACGGEAGTQPRTNTDGGADAGMTGPGLHVVGTKLIDGTTGQEVHLHGVNRPSTEWVSTGEMLSAADIATIASWKANVIRIPLNQDFWLPNAAQHDPNYAGTIAQEVAWAEANGMYVILDLHWSDAGDATITQSGQQLMADENSLAFWKDLAPRYANDPHVLYELYNEPHDIDWGLWLNGGATSGGWMGVGMQELYDAVRALAPNVILIGGNGWAGDLSGVPQYPVQGHDLMYVAHNYDFNHACGTFQPAQADASYGTVSLTYPVMMTEFGETDCSAQFVVPAMAYFDQHDLSWLAWAWYPGGCSFPAVINDWSGSPSTMGAAIQQHLGTY
jgi:hypothetical protein